MLVIPGGNETGGLNIPAPPSKAMFAVESSKNTCSDKSGEARGNHVAGVEDGHSSCDFLLSVEQRQKEESARIEL